MALFSLVNTSSRNPLHLGLRHIGKHHDAMWRSLRSVYPESTRIPFTGNFMVLAKHFSIWNKHVCVCSCQGFQNQRFRPNKLGFHSSRNFVQDKAALRKDEDDMRVLKDGPSKSSTNRVMNLTDQNPVDSSADNTLSLASSREYRVTNDTSSGHESTKTESSPELVDSSVQEDIPIKEPISKDDYSGGPPLTIGMLNEFMNRFFGNKEVRKAARANGLTDELYSRIFYEFRKKILLQMKKKNKEMMKTFRASYFKSDYMANLFPLFMTFARQAYPMLDCMDEVKKISDLRGPPDLFPEARTMKRKFIFHAGPTNSGKTHSAIERFRAAESGLYCGPLRLLATEVFQRTNDAGVPCDLLTGEDRQWAISPDEPANHIAATVEMCPTRKPYDCAVIDEIQMMRDTDRGWAWTRALLGLPCREIHLCGESSAVEVVQRLVASCNDELEVRHYERLSPLEISHDNLGSLANINSGDCVVAFSQRRLYQVRREIERKSRQKCAIIYGGLPPATKVEQAAKFNDPSDECSVLVASDAIGMGLNLNIKRIVFSTLTKYDGTSMVLLTASQAKQIAGRAGRYGTEHPEGEAITLEAKDAEVLHRLMSEPTEEVKTAGLAPSVEQIEMLAREMPDASLLKLYEVFESVVQLDGANYFMCDLDERKKIAEKLRGIALTISEQYMFSTAPINSSKTVVIDLAVKFAQYVSRDMQMTAARLEQLVKWPPHVPKSLEKLQNLEALHEGLDLYLWLSYRFPDVFVDQEAICEMQQYVEGIIGTVVSSNTLGALSTKTHHKNRHRFSDKKLIKWLSQDRF